MKQNKHNSPAQAKNEHTVPYHEYIKVIKARDHARETADALLYIHKERINTERACLNIHQGNLTSYFPNN